MAASTHWLATGTAQSVLERGGNAFDAAVAGCFVLHVAEPHLNGPGGDLVGLLSVAGSDDVRTLSGQGPAPRRASLEHFAAEGLDAVPGAGGLAAAVPGAVVALLELLARHGTWEPADVLEYAVGYARDGVPAAPQLVSTLRAVEPLFTEAWPTSRELWMPAGRVPDAGEPVRNPVYARTLERLLAAASGATRGDRIRSVITEWSDGFVAAAIEAFLREPHRHSDGRDRVGVLERADLSAYRPCFEAPVSLRFRGTTVVKSDAWASGPVLLQALAVLGHFPDDELDPSTARGAHLIVEAFKLAFADREAYYGDTPSRPAVGVLLDPAYSRARAALIDELASADWRPGRLPGRTPFVPPLRTADADQRGDVGEPTVRLTGETRGDTCHLDVVDSEGNMVSLTPSGGWLQSSPTVPELGFCVGTRLQMTWLDPQSPAALRPGARPRTTLSPTMLVRGGRAVEALGTPGGDQQDQWQLPYLLRRIVGGYDIQQAIDAPTFHTTHLPGSFWPRTWEPRGVVVEDRLGADVIEELRARGHAVTVAGPWSLSRLSAVARDPGTGELSAGANARGQLGYAAGR